MTIEIIIIINVTFGYKCFEDEKITKTSILFSNKGTSYKNGCVTLLATVEEIFPTRKQLQDKDENLRCFTRSRGIGCVSPHLLSGIQYHKILF